MINKLTKTASRPVCFNYLDSNFVRGIGFGICVCVCVSVCLSAEYSKSFRSISTKLVTLAGRYCSLVVVTNFWAIPHEGVLREADFSTDGIATIQLDVAREVF